jgi:hypothetical protein
VGAIQSVDPELDPYLTFAQQIPFNRELLRRANAIPGVELAAITSTCAGERGPRCES